MMSNALVLRLSVSELEQAILAAKENEATTIVKTKWEGKGLPECIHIVVEDDE